MIVLLAAAVTAASLHQRQRWHGNHRLIVLGIDGMDPDLLKRFMAAGKMPNFQKLAQQGSFLSLTTSIPPQSPVAWSNLITGMNSGGHGVFDFIHRDPRTRTPYFSTSRVEGPKHLLPVGSWRIPLDSGAVEDLRHGEAFWQVLDQQHIPYTVFRIPANFPPVPAKGNTLSGLGTPDLRGTYGTFSYYTDDPTIPAGMVDGGQIIPVDVKNGMVSADLAGPDNSFRKGSPVATEPFSVAIDPVDPVARIALRTQELVLREGEWSDWVHVEFRLFPYFGVVHGMCRFYLKQVHPRFQLYVSPMNIDPSDPALPISTPSTYARALAAEAGDYYTQGIAEDTKALSAGVLDDDEYLTQAGSVLAEDRRIFDKEFPKFKRGVFFFYFSTVDLNSHMFWRLMDPKHPAYDAALAAKNGDAIEKTYQQMDEVLGEILPHVDGNTTLMVVSDHGFAPYYRSFNLNTWLLHHGYLKTNGDTADDSEAFANVDWSRTQAYGLGLNGLYLNLRGREQNGVIKPGAEADALLQRLKEQLLAVRDPKTGEPVITHVDFAGISIEGLTPQMGPTLSLATTAAIGPDGKRSWAASRRKNWKTTRARGAAIIAWTAPWCRGFCSAIAKSLIRSLR